MANKNIVLCLDGTNNEYGDRNTNVVRLFEVLDTSDPTAQVAYYDPGIGTFSAHPVLGKPARAVMKAVGMAFGFGLSANVKEAYRFLMQVYRPGDRLYIIGFSRGAYTARVLAGLLNMCGLLQPGTDNLLDYALQIYARRDFKTAFGDRATGLVGFKKTFSRRCRVHFLGLWDTVSTVGWIWNPATYPYTYKANGVDTVRHAIAIDERRAFFPQNRFQPHRRVREAWFSGVHGDVGGGYPRDSDQLSRIPFEWILVEAQNAGLLINDALAASAVETTKPLTPPSFTVHTSLEHVWHLAEVFPKVAYSARWKRKLPRFNLWARREMPEGAIVHQSVFDKMNDDPDYRPPNLPQTMETEPWVRFESRGDAP